MHRLLFTALACLISVSTFSQSECEGVSIAGIHVNPFNTNELRLHSLNESEQEIFSYPGWRVYNEEGVLIAEEQIDLFGIFGNNMHSLEILSPIDYNTTSFLGVVELWTDFYGSLACSFQLEIFPWRVDEVTEDPYGCIPIQISLYGYSEQVTSIEIDITDNNSLIIFNETYNWDAGSYGGDIGIACLSQEECYYLSVTDTQNISNMNFSVAPVIEELNYFPNYLFGEVLGQEITLNPYNQGDCNSNNITSLNIFDYTKKLEKVVDALGREVNHTTNQILFYIYDDGTVEKKFFLSKF
tara:strand:- start:215 stop:1108 length:894 start_codon:yes stop_codon:yes gene_type:complete